MQPVFLNDVIQNDITLPKAGMVGLKKLQQTLYRLGGWVV